MKNTVFTLCNESIYPGEQLSLALALPELLSCAPLYMPIKVMSTHVQHEQTTIRLNVIV